jgi:hypothetical protein
MTRQTNLPTPERMQVIALHNPAVEANGHRPGTPYIEQTRSKWIFEVPEFVAGRVRGWSR